MPGSARFLSFTLRANERADELTVLSDLRCAAGAAHRPDRHPGIRHARSRAVNSRMQGPQILMWSNRLDRRASRFAFSSLGVTPAAGPPVLTMCRAPPRIRCARKPVTSS